MRKILAIFTTIIFISSSIFPVTACVFNFYIDKATETVIKSFANQTSSVVKSLVLGKEKSVDTAQTITDILSNFPNSSINNLTSGKPFNNLGDFINAWGENNQINFDGFDPDDGYFTATGQGSLTAKVNSYKKTNNTLSSLGYITGLQAIGNREIYAQLQTEQVRDVVFNFFNNAKQSDPAKITPEALYLKNLVLGKNWSSQTTPEFDDQSFRKNLVDPMSFLLDYFVDNKWSASEPGTTPSTREAFHEFMKRWKDPDDQFYSEWKGDLKEEYYREWDQTNYNFYRAGTLLNWLIYKIGKDYNIKKPGSSDYKDRYLGEIISEYVKILPPGIDLPNLEKDLLQYLPYITKNPLYLITLIQVLIPIIKQFVLKGNAVTGTKNLTFGQAYPTDKSKDSYNFSDIIDGVKTFINNPDQLRPIIKTLIGWSDYSDPGQSFLYDLKIHIPILGNDPLGALMKGDAIISIPEATKNDLINSAITAIKDAITKYDISGTLDTVSEVYNNWIKPYDDKKQGINISLSALRDFLTGDNGLLKVINQDLVIPVLFPILKNDPVAAFDEEQYKQFYQALGVQLPNEQKIVPENFRSGSVLDILKTNIKDFNLPLGQISLILFGDANQNLPGVFDNIINSNKKWIDDNYTALFDPTNKLSGSISQQFMTTVQQGNIITSNLQYIFSFKINSKNYRFLVKCISHDDATSYKGTKTFRFTDIALLT